MNTHPPIQVENTPDHSTIRFQGDIDAALIEKARPMIRDKLPDACRHIIVDLANVEFLDSHGVGFFASLLKKAHANKGILIFVAADGQPASVLKMVGFSGNAIRYCSTQQEAEQAIKNG